MVHVAAYMLEYWHKVILAYHGEHVLVEGRFSHEVTRFNKKPSSHILPRNTSTYISYVKMFVLYINKKNIGKYLYLWIAVCPRGQ